MDTSTPAGPPTDEPRSLLVPRVVALIGTVVAVVAVVAAFDANLWLGLTMLFVSPAIPMLFVIGAETARR